MAPSMAPLAIAVLAIAMLAVSSGVEVFEMHGSGTTNPSKLLWKIMDVMEDRARLPLHLSYRAVGSGTGIKEFVGEDNAPAFSSYSHFGSGDIPVDQTNFDKLTAQGIEMIHVPFVLGAISFFHSIPGDAKVNLTACLLSDIFQLKVTTWDDPKILAENPNLSVPAGQPISVVRRVYGSSSTKLVSQYLDTASTDSCSWDIGVGSGNADSSDPGVPTASPLWPSGTVPAEGSGGVSGYLEAKPYSIGYVDSGHGHSLGLKEIELQNKAGVFLTSKEADIGKAAEVADLPASGASWADVSIINQDGADTWPLTTFSYLFIRKDLSGIGEAGPLVKAMAQFILSKEGQSYLPEFGFSPVPPVVVTSGLAAVDTVVLDGAVAEWTFESATNAGAGAGERVLSVKRNTYASLADADGMGAVSELQAQVAAISARISNEEVYDMHGSGTTNPSKLLWKIMEVMTERASHPLHLTYRAVGSGTGIKEFVGEDNAPAFSSYSHFGSGDIPVDQTNFDKLTAQAVEMIHIPFVLGAISFFHSIPGDAKVNLTACLLSDIFQLKVTSWDDPKILAENPNLSVPAGQPISVVRRVYGSSSTKLVSQYLDTASTDSCSWDIGVGSGNADSSDPGVPTASPLWPSGTVPAEGSGGVSGYLEANPYSIGYVDSGHGHSLGLKEIELQNKAGVFLTSKEADIGKAAEVADLPASGASWADVSIINQDGADTWPLTTFSYLFIRKDLSGIGEAGPLVKAMAQFILSKEGQSYLPEFGFSPVPPVVVTSGLAAVDTLNLPAHLTEWFIESATAPGEGAGPRVISVKRKSYQTVVEDAQKAELAAVESTVARIVDVSLDRIATQSQFTVLGMHGSGTTNPSKLLWKIMDVMRSRTRIPLHLTYRAVGSGTGIKEFVGEGNTPAFTPYSDFGSGDIPVDQTNFDKLTAQGIEMIHIPFVLGAISFFHSIPGDAKVNLTACLLSDIFQLKVTSWDDPKILAENPNLSVPAGQPISVVRRVYGSSSTKLVSQYLDTASTDSCSWDIGVGSGNADSSDPGVPTASPLWPSGTVPAEGSGGVSGYLEANPYSIGYVDSGHGHSLGLKEIELQNKAGVFLTSKEADIGKAAEVADLPASGASWADVSIINQDGADTWPLTTFSYLFIRKDLSGIGEAGPLVKAMAQFILSEEGQSYLPEFGFSPVPPVVVTSGLAAVDTLQMAQGTPEWTFETATNAGSGAGSRVFSVKRETSLLGAAEASASDINALETGASTLQSELASLRTQLDAVMAELDESHEHDHDHDIGEGAGDSHDDHKTLAIVGVCLGLVALLVALVALGITVKQMGGASGSGSGSYKAHSNPASSTI